MIKNSEQDILHVYPQLMNHSPVQIKGTREGLLLLQKAINSLISKGGSPEGISTKFTTFASDGEGFEVTVEMLPQAVFGEEVLPYVEDIGLGCYQCRGGFSQDEQMGLDDQGEF